MNIKGLFITLLLTVFTATISNAQEKRTYNSEECAKYRSLYYQYLKQGAYRDATYFWTLAYDYCGGCDSLDMKFLSNGRVGYSKLLKEEEDKKEAGNADLIKNYRDTIYIIYECGMQIDDDPEWIADFASMLVSDKDPRHGKIDTLWAKSIHRLQDKASYIHIKQYFRHLIINSFNDAPNEEKDAVRTHVINEYIVLSGYCNKAISDNQEIINSSNDEKKKSRAEKEIKKYENAQEFLDKYFTKIVNDCAVLCRVLDGKLSKLPSDKEAKKAEVIKYMELMEVKECQSDSTYAKYLDELVKLDPQSAEVNYRVGINAYTNGNNTKAVNSLEKAVELEGAGKNANEYKYRLALAQYAAHQYKAAFRTAKSVGAGEFQGKAMVICGNAIAATANDCGETTFARKANYWLANDYYRKAASLGEDVSSGKFLSNAPTSTECFNENISEGSSFTLSCWGESTVVRGQ